MSRRTIEDERAFGNDDGTFAVCFWETSGNDETDAGPFDRDIPKTHNTDSV